MYFHMQNDKASLPGGRLGVLGLEPQAPCSYGRFMDDAREIVIVFHYYVQPELQVFYAHI